MAPWQQSTRCGAKIYDVVAPGIKASRSLRQALLAPLLDFGPISSTRSASPNYVSLLQPTCQNDQSHTTRLHLCKNIVAMDLECPWGHETCFSAGGYIGGMVLHTCGDAQFHQRLKNDYHSRIMGTMETPQCNSLRRRNTITATIAVEH